MVQEPLRGYRQVKSLRMVVCDEQKFKCGFGNWRKSEAFFHSMRIIRAYRSFTFTLEQDRKNGGLVLPS